MFGVDEIWTPTGRVRNTCIGASKDFFALGTNAGSVYIINSTTLKQTGQHIAPVSRVFNVRRYFCSNGTCRLLVGFVSARISVSLLSAHKCTWLSLKLLHAGSLTPCALPFTKWKLLHFFGDQTSTLSSYLGTPQAKSS